MRWFKAIIYGIILFALVFVIGSILLAGLNASETAAEIPMFITLVVVLWGLARYYRLRSAREGILVGLVWLIVYVILDYVLIVQIFGQGDTGYYLSWRLYLWYALMVVIPALVGSRKT